MTPALTAALVALTVGCEGNTGYQLPQEEAVDSFEATVREIDIADVSTDAAPGEDFKLRVAVDASGNLIGILTDEKIPVSQINQGVVVFREEDHNIDVLALKGSQISRRYGGHLTLDYLKNGIVGTRGNYGLELERIGDSWALYTDSDHGHYQIHEIFLSKNTVRGTVVGVSGVTVR